MLISNSIDAQKIIDSVRAVELAVLDVYHSSEKLTIDYKSDASPITVADRVAHRLLVDSLSGISDMVPIVSEEQNTHINLTNMKSNLYWLIDPIDGTKEFIARNGQFTICVALMKEKRPIFGVVSAPALNTLYYGGKMYGSYKVISSGKPQKIQSKNHKNIVYGSISNPSADTYDYIKKYYPECTIESVGSQLKFVYVAEGRAKAYPRIGSTMKIWDIAAGHAILEGAGGVIKRPNGDDILYDGSALYAGDFVASYNT